MRQKRKINRFIYWTPRILSIIFILFLALMSFDIFDLKLSFWQTLLGLFMHNIPALILLITLLISWKHELIGAIVFTLAGASHIIFTVFISQIPWYLALSWSIIVSGPAILIGLLFYLNWKKKKD